MWHIKQSCNTWYKKLKPKIVKHILVWFEIIIKFQNEMQNLTNFTHFEIIFIHEQWLTKYMWYIGTTICIFNKKSFYKVISWVLINVLW